MFMKVHPGKNFEVFVQRFTVRTYVMHMNYQGLQSSHIFIFTKGCLVLLPCITQGTTKTCVKFLSFSKLIFGIFNKKFESFRKANFIPLQELKSIEIFQKLMLAIAAYANNN